MRLSARLLRRKSPMNEIHYKIPWRARSSYPGHHSSQQKGGGLQFRHHVPLLNAPDPRRFDVRASLRDPFEQVYVRVYQQTSSIPVYVIADLSASMRYEGNHSKQDVVVDFVAAVSYAAYRTGDRFGFVGCGDTSTLPLVLPSTLNRAAGSGMAETLRETSFTATDSTGLVNAAALLGAKRALVFLISDFHFPEKLLIDTFATLAYHDVVPVVLWDTQEYKNLPNYGIARVRDQETGRSRTLLMRPKIKQEVAAIFEQRERALFATFTQFGRPPLFLNDGLEPDEVTRYFYQ
jgi:uncharacterized protein (DUF58 family)